MLYSPFDKYTTQKMLKILRSIIATYEPRIQVIEIPTVYSEDSQTFSMTIKYFIPALNANDEYQLELTR